MAGPQSLRILVIEDEFIIADEIAAMLEDGGHTVLGPVGSVTEAMRWLTGNEQPDATVIDANLRGESSVPVADRLRQLGVPFCVCTGYRSDDLRITFGEVEVLEKPINPGRLLSIVSRLTQAG